MCDDLEAAVFGQVEGIAHCRHCVSPIGLPGDAFVDGLDADFDPGAAVGEHFVEVGLEAVVRAGLDGDADALGGGLLGVADGLLDGVGVVAGEGVVEVADEVVLVGGVEGHEGAAHDDVLDLVYVVADGSELCDAAPGLAEGVIPGADGPHAGGLVAGVGLGGVLEVAVGAAGAVDADVAVGVVDVGAAVGLGHDGHHGNARGGADGLGFEEGDELLLV